MANNMHRNTLIEAIGWYGVVALLLAFALVSFDVLRSSSIWYQLLNLTGAAAIALDAFNQKNYQPGVLNVIWGIVALIALVRIFT